MGTKLSDSGGENPTETTLETKGVVAPELWGDWTFPLRSYRQDMADLSSLIVG